MATPLPFGQVPYPQYSPYSPFMTPGMYQNVTSPVVPEIAQAYQNDPRTKLAQAAITSGSSTDPVARGSAGYLDGIARALRGVAGGYIQGQQNKKFVDYQNTYLKEREAIANRGMATDPLGNPVGGVTGAVNSALTAPSGGLTDTGTMSLGPGTTAPSPPDATAPPPPTPPPPSGPPGAATGALIADQQLGQGIGSQGPLGPAQGSGNGMSGVGIIPTAPFPPSDAGPPPSPSTLNPQTAGGASAAGTPGPFVQGALPAPASSVASAVSGVLDTGGPTAPTQVPATRASVAPTSVNGLPQQAQIDVPAAPALVSKPDVPTAAPPVRSRALDAAYQMMLTKDPFMASKADELYASGLSDQDKINQAAIDRQADLVKAGYMNDSDIYKAQQQAQYAQTAAAQGENWRRSAADQAAQVADIERQRTEASQRQIEGMRIGAEEHEGTLNRANALTIASLRSTTPTEEELNAIHTAEADHRLNPQAVNSRNAKLIGGSLVAYPDMDVNQLNAVARLQANPAAQQKAGLLGSIPTVLKGVRDAGVALKLSDFGPIGSAQIAAAKLTNDPKWIELANRRVDASQTLSAVMGAAGATNLRTQMEQKAAAENMSPRAWNAWYKAQIGGVLPRMQWAESKGMIPQGTYQQMKSTYDSMDTPGAAPAATTTVPASSRPPNYDHMTAAEKALFP